MIKVLFETERFGDPDIDGKLLDVLFSIKQDVIRRLEPLWDEINAVDGEAVIMFTANKGGVRFLFMEMPLMLKANELIKDINFGDFVKTMMASKQN